MESDAVEARRRSVKATLRDIGSLKVAFTDFRGVVDLADHVLLTGKAS